MPETSDLNVAVVATGEQVSRVRALGAQVVATLAEAPEDMRVIVIGEPALVEATARVSYVARPATSDDDLRALFLGVSSGTAIDPESDKPTPKTPTEARQAQRAFGASRRLASATDLRATEAIAVETIAELVGADRAYCLFFQVDDGALWSEALQGDERRATSGIAGWCAHTGRAANVARGGDDARWFAAVDDPEGDAKCRLLVQPILGPDRTPTRASASERGGDDRVVHAVLVAVRTARASAFDDDDAHQLEHFARLAAPLLDQLSSHVEAQHVLDEQTAGQLFRPEALAAAEPQRWGDVVRVTPPWLAWAYRVLVVLLAASAVFVVVGRVATYSTGMAVIRSTARTSVTTNTSGNVSSVEVRPGDRVERGAIIARLDDVDQRAAVERLGREFETQLRNHMIDPNDQAADGSLRGLRLQLEQARAALDERLIRARTAGTLSDVRLRPGQRVEPGEIAASLVEGGGGLEVIALLPGEDRPQLDAGMQLRLELTGYRYAYQSLPIESVSAEVIAASEARRILGPEVADGMQIRGSVVVVRGRLAREDFEIDGQVYRYHDGMTGKAEVRLRYERIVFAIIPGLRRLE